MEKQELLLLIDRHFKGETSALEEQLLENFCNGFQDADAWDELREGSKAALVAQMRERLLEQIQEGRVEAPVHRIYLARKAWLRYAAAAIILFAVATTWLLISKKETRQETLAYTGDVPAPKSNKATLTLGNGKQIVLDSVGNGSLAREGADNVNKTGDAALAYSARVTNIEYHTLSNPKGSKPVELTLADGTKAWLNAASSITFPTAFTGATREVSITGEAYFDVVHNAEQPFKVKAANTIIEDIGTSFNVNAYSDEPAVKTTLVEGVIKIDHKLLQPGQQYMNGQVGPANIEQALAWKNGLFSFSNADIQTVMKQLARWYNVEVRYEGDVPSIPDFSGKMGRSLTLAQAMNALQSMRVHFRIEEDKRIVILP